MSSGSGTAAASTAGGRDGERAPAIAAQGLTLFVGRHREIDEACDLLDSRRLVTLTGPGGIGKTRLAMQVAERLRGRYADGVLLVELASATPRDDVAHIIADLLRLVPGREPDPTARLVGYLADRQELLVLDNCEHLLDDCRDLVTAVLEGAPGVRVLATSREGLGIGAEQVMTVGSLAVPDAVELLRRRFHDAAGVELDEGSADLAAEVCVRLDGLPLAIELAASRLRFLSMSDLVALLDDRFGLLTRGNAVARRQHRTLRAVVDWSWELCSPAEQRLWAQLSVFTGGADLDAVVAVCRVDGPAEDAAVREGPDVAAAPGLLDLVAALVHKSILIAETTRQRTRYPMVMRGQVFSRICILM